MAKLTPEVKSFIVQCLACYDTPSQAVAAVKKEFNIEVSRQTVEMHDPTKNAGRAIAEKWKQLFHVTRDKFKNDVADIPIANRAFRLRALNRMAMEAEGKRNYPLAAQIIEQAAKEAGGAYTNKQVIDHRSEDGSMSPKGFSADEYAAAQAKLKTELPDLD